MLRFILEGGDNKVEEDFHGYDVELDFSLELGNYLWYTQLLVIVLKIIIMLL